KRAVIPKVHKPVSLRESFDLYRVKDGQALGLFPWESTEDTHLRDVLAQIWKPQNCGCKQGKDLAARHCDLPPSEVWIYIGPEGGFSAGEAAAARQAGLVPVSLGPRILRTETAGIVAAALVLYASGDLG
ncbi:MAG: RsmE family RNA methyltransferase, partial [Firmicutes bacterium]|nr:RsmE family RNA methyltransferase [Bacillota bacterium]